MLERWWKALGLSVALAACGGIPPAETGAAPADAGAASLPDADAGIVVPVSVDAGSNEPVTSHPGPIDAGTTGSGSSTQPEADAGVSTPPLPVDAGPASTDAGAPMSGHWQPAAGTTWNIELDASKLDTSFNVAVYDIDLFDNDASVIAGLHAQGRSVVCYFSAGSYENWRPDISSFPASVLGSPLQGWPGEWWLDIRSQTVRDIMTKRMQLAVQKGCDAVDPDNVDEYTNSNGLGITAADQLDYNTFLANEAHSLGLAVGLKNDNDQVPQLVSLFDFTVNEQCFDYSECNTLQPFINANKPVFQIEYGTQSIATKDCPTANAMNFDTVVKNMNLDNVTIFCR